ncbi:MAG TPA: hypothetical protein VGQ30_06645, partial [Gemmatimonadaceae bacterium]|nr:hypothetical protein [Gemmatimonadaceae bacterium]
MRTRAPALSRNALWIAFAVAALTILAYIPALDAPFVLDDWVTIDAASRWETTAGMPTAGRPIVMSSLNANYQLNRALRVDQRPDPEGPRKMIGYRAFNILLHLLTGALLFAVLLRGMRETVIPVDWSAIAEPLAGVVTALWLLHPIQSEVIDYVVQRNEGLATLFYLAILYASQRAWAAPASRWLWYTAAAVACVLGMMSKEIVFTAPLLVMLYDRAFRLHSWKALLKPGHGRGWLYVVLWVIAIGTFTAMQIGARGDTSLLGVTMTPIAYLYTQCWAIAHYLQLTLWPSGLTLDYGFRPIHDARGVPGFILLAAMGAGTVYAWTRVARLGWLAFLGSMFFIVLAPSSSFVPQALEIAAERRTYLAVVPVLILLTVGVEWLRRKYAPRVSPQWLVAPIAIALAVTTAARSYAYNDPVGLWRSATRTVPENSRAFEQLGLALFTSEPPQLPAAESAFVRALAMDTSCQSGCLQYAALLSREERYAEAIPLLERQAGAIGSPTYNFMATRLLALALMKEGHYEL